MPFTTEGFGQIVVSLSENEDIPISDKDLFNNFEEDDLILDIQNSKFYLPNYKFDLIQSFLSSSSQYFEMNFLTETAGLLNEDSVIIDVGANIGNHTLYWANELHVKKIYAFEPMPYVFNILKKNIEINNLQDKVELYNCGLCDENCIGEVKTFCKQNLGGTNLKKKKSDTSVNLANLRTLDSFEIEDKIDLLKIDAEGMEYEVLCGAVKTIKKSLPPVFIESFGKTFDKTNSFLEDLGYSMQKDLGCCNYFYKYGKREK